MIFTTQEMVNFTTEEESMKIIEEADALVAMVGINDTCHAVPSNTL